MSLPLLYQATLGTQKLFAWNFHAFWSQLQSGLRFLAFCWNDDWSRRSHFAPILMGIGISLYFYLPFEPPLWSATLVTAILFNAWLWHRSRSNVSATASAVILLISIGFLASILRTTSIYTAQIEFEQPNILISGVVEQVGETSKHGARLTLRVFQLGERRIEGILRIRLSTSKQRPDIEIGNWIEARADLKPLPPPVMPAGFDFARKLWFEGVRGTAFTIQDIEIVQPPQNAAFEGGFLLSLGRLRQLISTRILIQMSERAGPVATAFLTGERSQISDADNEAMRVSSLAHLLSISGLHMMLAGFGFFAAIRFAIALVPQISQLRETKKWAAAASLLVSFAYLILSGASVPTQRAFLTVTLAFIAIMSDRTAITMRTVALAATLILLLTPEAWMDPSFQMSFGAVTALVAAYEWWNERRLANSTHQTIVRRIFSAIAASATTSAVAGLATAPFAAFHFNRVSVYGVVSNVIVMPIVSLVIMPSGVLALLLMPMGLEWIPLQIMDAGLIWMLDAAHWIAAWPFASVGVPSFSVEALLILSLGLLWIALWQSSWRWFGIPVAVIAIVVAMSSTRPSILISTSGKNIAVRSPNEELNFLSTRRARFDTQMWLRADGEVNQPTDQLKSSRLGFICNASKCAATMQKPMRLVVVATDSAVVGQACELADVLITPFQNTRCDTAELVADKEFLSSQGATAIWYKDEILRWSSVAQVRGVRPWVAINDQPPKARERVSSGGTNPQVDLAP